MVSNLVTILQLIILVSKNLFLFHDFLVVYNSLGKLLKILSNKY